MVRVVGVPDLSGLAPESRAESTPVFERLIGTYRRIAGFDRYGHAEIRLVFRGGAEAGHHTVWIEPFLLRRKAGRRPPGAVEVSARIRKDTQAQREGLLRR